MGSRVGEFSKGRMRRYGRLRRVGLVATEPIARVRGLTQAGHDEPAAETVSHRKVQGWKR